MKIFLRLHTTHSSLNTINQNVYEANQTEAKYHHEAYTSEVPDIAITIAGAASAVVIWTVLFVILSRIRSLALQKIIPPISSSKQVPCRNCRFYTNNHYLKCAVQPSVVMTEEARTCSDFQQDEDIN